MFLLAVASDWVQLPMVEPGGKLKFKPRPQGNEEDYQSQSPEAKWRTEETQMKAETMHSITKFASERTSDTVIDQFSVNTENEDSGTQIHNTELNLNHDDLVIQQSIPDSHYSKHDSHDSTENNNRSQMSEETFESILEREASDINTPHFKVYLETSNLNSSNFQTSNLNTPNFQPGLDLEVTTMHVDAKLPNPGIHDYPPDKDSTSKLSDSFYETNSTPYPTIKQNNENPEGLMTITKSNISSIDDESGTSWIYRTGNSNNETEENTMQDASLPLDMLKTVHEMLIQETPHTIRGKMHFLQQLKDKMLHCMEGRIKGLWMTDDERQARTEKGMGFPSMEGALMSISFLIFAVFLIKLVQQLIQSLQGNNMAMMSGRHSRSLPDILTTARVLKLIDEFQFQYKDNGWS
ncbi:uncharacterized protein LOC111868349 [Cryptotermes secundus]|uniref:uncharacterized protein LOC111868349 n=1 Tax=Cryptotermes secundus TaxID=105785 RepID=UPI001454D4C9|nr:uncharacterized protein LOC111868349 [Cryptotermes secundus]